MSSTVERRIRERQKKHHKLRLRRNLYGAGASLIAAAGTFAAGGTGQADAQSQHDAKANAVVSAAFHEQGKRFADGASGPSSFDCSGFTRFVYQRAHVNLPRTSQAQYRTGSAVSRSNIRPGDLVFFSTAGGGPTHVGIAIGNGNAISATSHGVRQHSISGSYWGSHYVGARREF